MPIGDPCLGGTGGGGQDYGYCPDIQSNILCTETFQMVYNFIVLQVYKVYK
ncbi:hypothetical protein [Chryseobacterium sp. c4a]|uniref:hypothetical protein n=1 Tax=Chryseobacterium sp. c4a TaxID=1573582 RepID=UPI00135A7651|nr:hypothetical protein [Chryseobacterium sp. c4a]